MNDLEPRGEWGYSEGQVLVTPQQRLPAPSSRFFCAPIDFFLWGDGLDRKAGRPPVDGLRTSPRPRLRNRGTKSRSTGASA